MLGALRSRSFSVSTATSPWKQAFSLLERSMYSSAVETNIVGKDIDVENSRNELLKLEEVEKILNDVKADNVKVIPVPKHLDFADYMVIATGRSTWHVRNIAQALIYSVKQKQKGAKRMVLPSVEGQEGGNWIVIDSGTLIIHALDERVRAYYNLEGLWTTDNAYEDQSQDLHKAFVKVRRKNNSKKQKDSVS